MAETYSGEFYCVKCKEKREASGDVHVNEKGTRMAKAKCPVCGTNLNRILGKAYAAASRAMQVRLDRPSLTVRLPGRSVWKAAAPIRTSARRLASRSLASAPVDRRLGPADTTLAAE